MSLALAKLLCEDGWRRGWEQTRGIFLARLKVARAFEAVGVKFIAKLGIGIQSAAYEVELDGRRLCLKLTIVDNRWKWRGWRDDWGSRPFDMPILAQADFYLTVDEEQYEDWDDEMQGGPTELRIKAVFQEIGRGVTDEEYQQTERYWRWLGFRIEDNHPGQWLVAPDGQVRLTDYVCISDKATEADLHKRLCEATTKHYLREARAVQRVRTPRTHRSEFCHCPMCRTVMLAGRTHPDLSEF